jgi:hypothetical protein
MLGRVAAGGALCLFSMEGAAFQKSVPEYPVSTLSVQPRRAAVEVAQDMGRTAERGLASTNHLLSRRSMIVDWYNIVCVPAER